MSSVRSRSVCTCRSAATSVLLRLQQDIHARHRQGGALPRILGREIGLQAALFRDDPRVSQMHWGGGTPTFYGRDDLRALFDRLTALFDFSPGGDYSIEVDPRTVDEQAIHDLRAMGFNRVSFGVQDFEPGVQTAVHRHQSREHTLAVIGAARRAGFESINVDLIYGLPKQTYELQRYARGGDRARPPHRSLYYAHLPALFKAQPAHLRWRPARAGEKLSCSGSRCGGWGRRDTITSHGSLRAAGRRARGGARQDGCIGASRVLRVRRSRSRRARRLAISAVGPTYSQNLAGLKNITIAWIAESSRSCAASALTADDLVRRAVIQSLMCQSRCRRSRSRSPIS